MKKIIYVLTLVVFACSVPSKDSKTLVNQTIEETNNESNSNFKQSNIEDDTLLIFPDIDDTLLYSKNDFQIIIEKHPEFFEEYIGHPDQLYYNHHEFEYFSSEVGQDNFYMIYAYFLREKVEGKFSKKRKQLIEIYRNINRLHSRIQYSGTYFGHQYYRICGYAEYDLYYHSLDEEFEKTYNISKQKKLYIKSLRQLIEDEMEIDFEVQSDHKKIVERRKSLNEIVDKIERSITDIFFLRKAQAFHYKHYVYI